MNGHRRPLSTRCVLFSVSPHSFAHRILQLKSLNQLISTSVPHLHFALMCLIRVYGHTLLVVSKLPLGKNTLIYGSGDAGATIHTDKVPFLLDVRH